MVILVELNTARWMDKFPKPLFDIERMCYGGTRIIDKGDNDKCCV